MENDRIDELRRTAYPNPERIGCPEPAVFEALKRREIAFDDPVWAHIERCSPCYRQFADIREKLFRQDRINDFRKTARAALLAIVLVAVGASLYMWQRNKTTDAQSAIASNQGEAAVLNFEDGSELRGAQARPRASDNSGIQHLPRNRLNITVYLPLGSPAGEYELEIVRASGESVWRAQARATIKDGLTSIPVNGDLRSLSAGEYRFRFRRLGETWHEKTVLVK